MLRSIIEEVLEDSNASGENTNEKMQKADKLAAKKRAKSPEGIKAKKLKAKCMANFGDKVRKSKGKLTCGTDGKVKKGMDKKTKKLMAKAKKKNKNKLV